MPDKVVNLFQWEVVDFPWGTAVREKRTGEYVRIFLKPQAQEIDVEHIPVELHENGIEFLDI
jgi:hypothetical protein